MPEEPAPPEGGGHASPEDGGGLVPPLKVLRKRLNGVYRADGFSGPTRRYVLIVVLLVGLASLPTLAAILAGTNQLDSGTTGAMDVPFLPPPSSGPVTPYVAPSPAPSVGQGGSRRRAEKRQTKNKILYGRQNVPLSTPPRTNRGSGKKSTVGGSQGTAAVHKHSGSRSNAGHPGSGHPAPRPVSGAPGNSGSGSSNSGSSGSGPSGSDSSADESSSSSDEESSPADESESGGDDDHQWGGWHHRGSGAHGEENDDTSDVDRPRWSRRHHCEDW